MGNGGDGGDDDDDSDRGAEDCYIEKPWERFRAERGWIDVERPSVGGEIHCIQSLPWLDLPSLELVQTEKVEL